MDGFSLVLTGGNEPRGLIREKDYAPATGTRTREVCIYLLAKAFKDTANCSVGVVTIDTMESIRRCH
jgi:hypothetical protein